MLRGILAVFIGAASYGILSTIAKLSYAEGYNPEDATVFQIVFGFVVLLILSFFQKKKIHLNSLDKKEITNLSLGGATIALTSLFYYSCVQYIPASMGIILLFQFIWIGVLFDFFFNKKTPSYYQIGALVLLLLGTFLASGIIGGFENSEINLQGLILGLLSALCYASYIFVNGKLKSNLSALSKSTLMMGVSSVIILIVYPPTSADLPYLNIDFLTYGIPLALFGAVIPPILFAYGVPKIGVTYSSILSSVELPVAVVFSILLLGEKIEMIQWIGIFFILFSVLGVSLKK